MTAATRYTPAQPNEVFYDGSTLTVTARAVRVDDRVVIRATVGVGPGTGPHELDDPRTLRRWAWILHHAADAMEAAGDPPPAPEPDPQLTLADAPIADGHTPMIRIEVTA